MEHHAPVPSQRLDEDAYFDGLAPLSIPSFRQYLQLLHHVQRLGDRVSSLESRAGEDGRDKASLEARFRGLAATLEAKADATRMDELSGRLDAKLDQTSAAVEQRSVDAAASMDKLRASCDARLETLEGTSGLEALTSRLAQLRAEMQQGVAEAAVALSQTVAEAAASLSAEVDRKLISSVEEQSQRVSRLSDMEQCLLELAATVRQKADSISLERCLATLDTKADRELSEKTTAELRAAVHDGAKNHGDRLKDLELRSGDHAGDFSVVRDELQTLQEALKKRNKDIGQVQSQMADVTKLAETLRRTKVDAATLDECVNEISNILERCVKPETLNTQLAKLQAELQATADAAARNIQAQCVDREAFERRFEELRSSFASGGGAAWRDFAEKTTETLARKLDTAHLEERLQETLGDTEKRLLRQVSTKADSVSVNQRFTEVVEKVERRVLGAAFEQRMRALITRLDQKLDASAHSHAVNGILEKLARKPDMSTFIAELEQKVSQTEFHARISDVSHKLERGDSQPANVTEQLDELRRLVEQKHVKALQEFALIVENKTDQATLDCRLKQLLEDVRKAALDHGKELDGAVKELERMVKSLEEHVKQELTEVAERSAAMEDRLSKQEQTSSIGPLIGSTAQSLQELVETCQTITPPDFGARKPKLPRSRAAPFAQSPVALPEAAGVGDSALAHMPLCSAFAEGVSAEPGRGRTPVSDREAKQLLRRSRTPVGDRTSRKAKGDTAFM